MAIPKKTNKKPTQNKRASKKSFSKPTKSESTTNSFSKKENTLSPNLEKKPTNAEVAKSAITKAEQMDIDHLFAQALSRYKKEEILEKKEKVKEMSHLALIAEEYLSSFALIGYSLQNEKVVIFNMPSPKDEAALVDLLRATFIDIANNRP